MLHVAIPKANVLIVVLEIISAIAVLMVLKPLAFVLLSIGELIDAIAFPLPFDILSLMDIAIAEGCGSRTIRLTLEQFAELSDLLSRA